MAASKKRTFSGNSNNARFVDLSLSSTSEKELKAAQAQRPQWLSALAEIIADGYKITFKKDARNSSIMAMVQDADYDPDIAPTIYVMRSRSAEGALLRLCWYWTQSDGTLPDPDVAIDNDLDDSDIFA